MYKKIKIIANVTGEGLNILRHKIPPSITALNCAAAFNPSIADENHSLNDINELCYR